MAFKSFQMALSFLKFFGVEPSVPLRSQQGRMPHIPQTKAHPAFPRVHCSNFLPGHFELQHARVTDGALCLQWHPDKHPLPSWFHFGLASKRDSVTDDFTKACRFSTMVIVTLSLENCLPASTNGKTVSNSTRSVSPTAAPAVTSHSRLHLSSP